MAAMNDIHDIQSRIREKLARMSAFLAIQNAWSSGEWAEASNVLSILKDAEYRIEKLHAHAQVVPVQPGTVPSAEVR